MRIALALIGLSSHGGKQRDCLELARHLRSRGHSIVIMATSISLDSASARDLDVMALPVRAFSNHARAAAFAQAVNAAVAAAKAAGKPYDAVVAFDKLPGCTYYYASDVCFAGRSRGLSRWTPRHLRLRALEHALIAPPSATHVFYLTAAQCADYAASHGAAPGRATILPVIRHGDRKGLPSEFYATRAAVRAELNLPGDAFLAVHLATKPVQKGYDRVLAAMVAEPRLHVAFAGSGDPVIERLARKLGVADHIRTLPYVDDVPRLLGGSDLLVHPARVEAGGIVIIEALAAGLPVIVTALCGYAAEVAKASAGIVLADPFVQADLDAAVRMLMARNANYKQAAQVAAREIESRPSWLDVVAAKIETDYAQRAE